MAVVAVADAARPPNFVIMLADDFAYELLCDPAEKLAPLLDARVDTDEWVTRDERGQINGRALELCLVAKRCLEHHRVRSTMRDAMPAIVALAQQGR